MLFSASAYLSKQTLRLSGPGFGLNDHYRRTLNDKSSVGQIPLHVMNLATVQYVFA